MQRVLRKNLKEDHCCQFLPPIYSKWQLTLYFSSNFVIENFGTSSFVKMVFSCIWWCFWRNFSSCLFLLKHAFLFGDLLHSQTPALLFTMSTLIARNSNASPLGDFNFYSMPLAHFLALQLHFSDFFLPRCCPSRCDYYWFFVSRCRFSSVSC